MAKICEKIVNSFIGFFCGKNISAKESKGDRRDEYTLSSVFPTKQIMKDVKEII